jgi:hypothetical protein
MKATKLFILFLTFTITYGFLPKLKHNNFIQRFKINQVFQLNTISVCFEDDHFKHDKNNDKNDNDKNISIYMNPIYTIIWHDCDECKMLLEDMKKMHMEFEYIDFYLNMFWSHGCEHNTPVFLLNNECIGNTLFEIYEIMYSSIKY